MRKNISDFIRTVQAACTAGSLFSVLRMRKQVSDFIKTVQTADTAGRLSLVLRMRIQMSDIQVRPISSASRRYSWKLIFGPAHAQTSVRFHQNSSNRRYSWKLIFGPAHAHTNVRYPGQAHQQRQPQVQLEAYLRSCACAYKFQISGR
jgi:hypothetical protein